MLTISQLASYAGVTVRAVRHYHNVGLLPEPDRGESGYRDYDAAAVVRLIRIRTLRSAGVPLARVQELLDADPDEFAQGVREIDAQLQSEISRLQTTRERIMSSQPVRNSLFPQVLWTTLTVFVDSRSMSGTWRWNGTPGSLAARVPHLIESISARKQSELDDPDMIRLYQLLSGALDWHAGDPRVVDIADVVERLIVRALPSAPTATERLRRSASQTSRHNDVQLRPDRRGLTHDPRAAWLEGLDADRPRSDRS